jgi:hypothetical protein
MLTGERKKEWRVQLKSGRCRVAELKLPARTKLDQDAGSGYARSGEGSGGGLGDFDIAVEEIFSGGEELEVTAHFVRRVGVHPEVTVQHEQIQIVVVLATA